MTAILADIAASPMYSKIAGWSLIVLACIGIMWFGASQITHRVETWKAGVVEAAHAEVREEQLKEGLAHAEKVATLNRRLADSEARFNEKAAARQQAIVGQTRTAEANVRQQIADGEIVAGALSPVTLAAIDQFEAMEAERIRAGR